MKLKENVLIIFYIGFIFFGYELSLAQTDEKELEKFLLKVRATLIIQNANNVNNNQSKKSITDGSYSIDLEIEKEFSKNDKAYLYFQHGNGTGVTDELQLFGNVNADATGDDNLSLIEGLIQKII